MHKAILTKKHVLIILSWLQDIYAKMLLPKFWRRNIYRLQEIFFDWGDEIYHLFINDKSFLLEKNNDLVEQV